MMSRRLLLALVAGALVLAAATVVGTLLVVSQGGGEESSASNSSSDAELAAATREFLEIQQARYRNALARLNEHDVARHLLTTPAITASATGAAIRCGVGISLDFPDQVVVTIVSSMGVWSQIAIDPEDGVDLSSANAGNNYRRDGIDPSTWPAEGILPCDVEEDGEVSLRGAAAVAGSDDPVEPPPPPADNDSGSAGPNPCAYPESLGADEVARRTGLKPDEVEMAWGTCGDGEIEPPPAEPPPSPTGDGEARPVVTTHDPSPPVKAPGECSQALARWLSLKARLEPEGNPPIKSLLEDRQVKPYAVICRDFTGDGKDDISFGVNTVGGNWNYSVAFARAAPDGSWALVHSSRDTVILRYGDDLLVSSRVFVEGEPHCCSTGGWEHTRLHWDGSRLQTEKVWRTQESFVCTLEAGRDDIETSRTTGLDRDAVGRSISDCGE